MTIFGVIPSVEAKADTNGKFATVIELAEGGNTIRVQATNDSVRSNTVTIRATCKIDPATYKAQCQDIDFTLLKKNPEAYKGTKYFTTGHVAEVQYDSAIGNTILQVAVTENRNAGFWTDTIWVKFTGKTPAVRDSIVNVWGDVSGSDTHETEVIWNNQGTELTLPAIQAKFVEVVTQ